ncbi:hypothetical protein, partial [Alteromonas mediterranea]|uniref:hypothetical protein n=1 Tax=Alteromonas mediterranea TaxID=314275 RepID=UPI002023DE1B
TILDCKLALCHLASDMKYAGAVYEARTYGSVRGMRRKPHPTRCIYYLESFNFLPAKPHVQVRLTPPTLQQYVNLNTHSKVQV